MFEFDWVTFVSVVITGAGTFIGVRVAYKKDMKQLQLEKLKMEKEMVSDDQNNKRSEFEIIMDRYDKDNQRLRQRELELEQKFTELEQKFNELQYRFSLLESINQDLPVPHWVKDNSGVILSLNQSCYDTFIKHSGVPFNEVKGKTDYDFFNKETADTIALNDNKVRRTKKVLKSNEVLDFGTYTQTWRVLRWAIQVQNEVVANGGIAIEMIEEKIKV